MLELMLLCEMTQGATNTHAHKKECTLLDILYGDKASAQSLVE